MEAKIIKEICRRYQGCSKDYYVDSIPDRKAQGAREGLGLSAGEEIVALVDFTVMGGASEAFVVTDLGICWKNTGDDAPRRLTWAQLRGKTLTWKKGFATHEIDFGSGLKMSLVGALFEGDKGSQLAALLRDLQKLNSLVTSKSQEVTTTTNGDQGYVTCEYCSGLVKPDVTYCKHCGIKLRG